MLGLEVGIHNTVELNVSGEGGAGESTENCNSSQSLFQVFLLVFCVDVQELSFCKNRWTEHEESTLARTHINPAESLQDKGDHVIEEIAITRK